MAPAPLHLVGSDVTGGAQVHTRDSHDSPCLAAPVGHQSSLGAVNGPMEVRIRDELTDRSTLEVTHFPLDGLPGIACTSFTASLHAALSSVVLLHLHPRTLKQLTLQSTNHAAPRRTVAPAVSAAQAKQGHRQSIRPRAPHPDAELPPTERAALINAAMLALIQAGVPCSATVCAVAVAVLPRRLARSLQRSGGEGDTGAMDQDSDSDSDSDEDGGEGGSVVLVDPDPTEEACASSTHVLAFACSGQVVRGDGGGDSAAADEETESEAEARLVLVQSSGALPLSTVSPRARARVRPKS